MPTASQLNKESFERRMQSLSPQPAVSNKVPVAYRKVMEGVIVSNEGKPRLYSTELPDIIKGFPTKGEEITHKFLPAEVMAMKLEAFHTTLEVL